MNSTPSVILGHGHTLLRAGLAAILEQGGFRVVGQGSTLSEVEAMAHKESASLVIIDWELPDCTPDALRSMASKLSFSRIIILTRPQPAETLKTTLEAGATGYLSVNMSPKEFVEALSLLSTGDVVVTREMLEPLRNEMALPSIPVTRETLSEREREVVALVGQGATNKEIAQALVVTPSTVKTHLRRILNKLDLHNRQQVAAYSAGEGIVQIPKPEGGG